MVYEPYRRAKSRPLLSRHDRLRGAAKALGLSGDAKKRLDWIIYFEGRGNGSAALTARYFGIGVSTFHKWHTRFNEEHLQRLESRSRAPVKRRSRQATPLQDRRTIDLRRRYPYWGKMKLKALYESTYGEEISSWCIQRIIEHYRLYAKKRKRKLGTSRKTQVKKRISACEKKPETGFLLHLDTIVLHLCGTKRYILTAIDDHSKIAFARMYTSHASLPARDFFERLFLLFDERVVNVHTDNGSEFHKYFDLALTELNLPHYWSRSRTPKDNPSNERFNRTLKEEFLYWGNFHPDPDIFNLKLGAWLVEYNAVRPHSLSTTAPPLISHSRRVGCL